VFVLQAANKQLIQTDTKNQLRNPIKMTLTRKPQNKNKKHKLEACRN
jgi:hypothetical protein